MMDLSFFLFITCTLHSVFGFAPTHTQYSRGGAASAPLLTKEKWSQPLQMSNIFDEMGKFFNGIGKNEVYKPNFDLPEVEDIDGEYVGSKRIITIPGEHSFYDFIYLLVRYFDIDFIAYCQSLLNYQQRQ